MALGKVWRAFLCRVDREPRSAPPRPVDPDAAALQLLVLALSPLDLAARARVLRYAWGRFVNEPSSVDQIRKKSD